MSAAASGETLELRAVELDFLESAPHRFEYAEPVGAPVDRVFAAIAADPSTWTWFPGIEEGAYETSAPGVGARRWVRIGGVKYRETMLAWDAPRRWTYRVDETSAPVFAALAEDWVVEPDGHDAATVHWTFAFDPLPAVASVLIEARDVIGSTFRDAMRGLDDALR
jgi:hypothetical protein